MTRYLLDSNVVINHLNQTAALPAPPWNGYYGLSVITQAEVLRLRGIGSRELRVIEDFFNVCAVVNVNSAIACRAAELGRTRKTKLPDLLIAATALDLGIPLITKDQKGYARIPKLKVRTSL